MTEKNDGKMFRNLCATALRQVVTILTHLTPDKEIPAWCKKNLYYSGRNIKGLADYIKNRRLTSQAGGEKSETAYIMTMLKSVQISCEEMLKIVNDNSHIESWVAKKMTLASDELVKVANYLLSKEYLSKIPQGLGYSAKASSDNDTRMMESKLMDIKDTAEEALLNINPTKEYPEYTTSMVFEAEMRLDKVLNKIKRENGEFIVSKDENNNTLMKMLGLTGGSRDIFNKYYDQRY